uniref:hypothetical protein n=1 Tax=Rheinheimera sp. TaxID=1869214 RepID=UPI0040472B35
MSGVIRVLHAFWRAYGRPALLALLLHAMLLAALLDTRFSPVAPPPQPEPVLTYLYQPTLPVQTDIAPQPMAENTLAPDAMQPELTHDDKSTVPAAGQAVATPAAAVQPMQDKTPSPDRQYTEPVTPITRPGLAQRALNRGGTIDPAAIEQAATANYQQLLQAQQQPKITVEKRHQTLSNEPAQQVVAQLGDGRQLIRTKGGCRVADPSKQGFDALMAARMVSCGDEADRSTSALLQQALEKHIKR